MKKRAVGRPRFFREPLSERIHFRVTADQRQQIVEAAAAMGCNEVDVVRAALDAYLTNRRRSRKRRPKRRPR